MSQQLNQRKTNTVFARAFRGIDGFEDLAFRMLVRATLNEQSSSMYRNYAHHLAQMALHFGCLPTKLDCNQVNDYLFFLKKNHKSVSQSFFKFTVYGLRYIYRMEGQNDKVVQLPRIKHDKKLPVVLSRQEVKRLLIGPKQFKHRIILGLLYGCGLRSFELRGLRVSDLYFDRKMLDVRMGKGRKDRYLPLSDMLIRGLKKYIENEKPTTLLFRGNSTDSSWGRTVGEYSRSGVQWAIKQATKNSGIAKKVSAHTLRHTYATHLLEDGLNIITIKNLLGHVRLETTLVYLNVIQSDYVKPYSPLDTLYRN